MGGTMVPGAAGAVAEREDHELTEPSVRGVLMTGLPGVLREGFLPLGAFYAGLEANSAVVYLAQPVLVAAAWGLAFLVSIAIGRPLAGALACAWYPFPQWL